MFFGIGILRFLFAISVVEGHTDLIIPGYRFFDSGCAVESFYIISGFYMALILNRKYLGRGSYFTFLSNRFLKLYPMYISVVFIILLWINYPIISSTGISNIKLLPSGSLGYDAHLSDITYLYLLICNYGMILLDSFHFLAINPSTGILFFTSDFYQSPTTIWPYLFIPPAWTIGVEFLFYAIAPFLVRRNSLIICTIIIASMFFKFIMLPFFGLFHDPWNYRFLPAELYLFMMGSISYKIFTYFEKTEKIQHITANKKIYLLIFFIIIFIPIIYSSYKSPFMYVGYHLLLMLGIPFLFLYSQHSKIDSTIGELSYPVYINHFFVGQSIVIPFFNSLSFSQFIGIGTVLISIIMAGMMNIFIQNPIDKYRQNRVKRGK